MGFNQWFQFVACCVLLHAVSSDNRTTYLNIGFAKDAGTADVAATLPGLEGGALTYDVNNASVHLGIVSLHVDPRDAYRSMFNICKDVMDTTPIVLSTASCVSQSYVRSVLTHMRIPTLSVTMGHCVAPQSASYMTVISPLEVELTVGRSHISEVLLNMIQVQKWESFILIYDELDDNPLVTDMIMSFLEHINVTAAMFAVPIGGSQDVGSILQAAKLSPELAVPYLVLAASSSQLLLQAHRLQMMGQEYRWLIRAPSEADVDLSWLNNEDNIAMVLEGADIDIQEQTTAVMQEALGSVAQSHQILSQAGWVYDDLGDPHSPSPCCHRQLPLTQRQHIMQELRDNLPASSPYNKTYPEYRILSSVVRGHNEARVEEVGRWTSDKQLDWSEALFPNSFNGFNNRTFVVASLEYSFFQQKEYLADGSFKWVGLTFTLLDELAQDLNFSYVVVEPPDGMWGIIQDDGNWNGMIKQVVDKSVDFAAACFSITADRESATDFAEPYFHELSAVIIKRPEGADKIALYLKPFSREVWGCILLAVTFYGTLLWLFTRHSPYYYGKIGYSELEYGAFQIQNALLYFYGCFVQQGGVWMPASQSGRCLVGCFWFLAIVLVATYTGNLIAFLAVNSVNLPFDTLAEMVQQNQIAWGPAAGVAMVMLFRDMRFEPYTSVYAGMTEADDYSDGLQRVKDGKYAFIAEKSYYQAEVARDCRLAMIKETFYPTNYGWSFPEKSPFIPIFNDRINKLRETGLLTHWTKQWTPQALNCTGLKPVTNAKVVDLTDFQGAVYVLGTGAFLAVVTLCFEFLVHFKRKRNEIAKYTKDIDSSQQDLHLTRNELYSTDKSFY